MIAIDTCVVSWGILYRIDPHGRPMVEQAVSLLELYQEEEILIPMPALAEALSGIEIHGHQELLDEVHKPPFVLGDFNEAAAVISARMERLRLEERKRSGLTQPSQAVKVDVFIAAIAIAKGAPILFTDNVRDFEKLTRGESIEIRPLPDLPTVTTTSPPSTE